jgi:hypothetical protein
MAAQADIRPQPQRVAIPIQPQRRQRVVAHRFEQGRLRGFQRGVAGEGEGPIRVQADSQGDVVPGGGVLRETGVERGQPLGQIVRKVEHVEPQGGVAQFLVAPADPVVPTLPQGRGLRLAARLAQQPQHRRPRLPNVLGEAVSLVDELDPFLHPIAQRRRLAREQEPARLGPLPRVALFDQQPAGDADHQLDQHLGAVLELHHGRQHLTARQLLAQPPILERQRRRPAVQDGGRPVDARGQHAAEIGGGFVVTRGKGHVVMLSVAKGS